jgi:di/tricarboxylate transporter
MSQDQTIVFAVLGAALVLFAWGRWRYDLVAVLALLALVFAGIVPAAGAFQGFAHPAVLTVATVLMISRALQNAGVVDWLLRAIAPLRGRPGVQVAAQTSATALMSTVMNNVGALALMLPVALRNAYREKYAPARSLMPLAFGSLLGGLVTLIGTPPNIIVSAYRQDAVGRPYEMFDFAPVGGGVAIAGVLFLLLVGWRLIPRARLDVPPAYRPFDAEKYLMEARVPEGGRIVGISVEELERNAGGDVRLAGLGGDDRRMRLVPSPTDVIGTGDVLLLQGDPEALKAFLDRHELTPMGSEKLSATDPKAHVEIMEVIVKPGSLLTNRSPASMRLRTRYNVNLLGIARYGRQTLTRLGDARFQVGDVLMLQGAAPDLEAALGELGGLPLAERPIDIGKPRRLILTIGAFGAAIAAAILDLVPIHVAFLATVAFLILTRVLRLDEAYAAVDWPVIVLLGAMLPVGGAVASTGGTTLVAAAILEAARGLSPFWVLALLLVSTMMLSDVINNNATAVLMAPIALTLAEQLQVNPDAFLMSVALGASCAFLTPIGHQSNTLVLAPGGYQFGDYWRVGLPLELVIAAVALPLLLHYWPL